VTWHKDNNNVNASKRILIGKPVLDSNTQSFIYSLTILDSTLADSGVYTIKASNKVSTVESISTVNIFSPPRIIKDLKPQLECSEGDKVSLEVHVAGKPLPEFKWYHFNTNENSEVEVVPKENILDTRVQSESVYIADFYCISKEMAGKYILKLSNNAGSIETSCNIIVNGKFYKFNYIN
jgi:hypothetical protein